jgi:hypothetical protein
MAVGMAGAGDSVAAPLKPEGLATEEVEAADAEGAVTELSGAANAFPPGSIAASMPARPAAKAKPIPALKQECMARLLEKVRSLLEKVRLFIPAEIRTRNGKI